MKKIFRRTHDPIWHMQLGVAAIIGLQLLTAHSFFPANKVALIVLELVLLFCLGLLTSDGYHRISKARRTIAVVLISIVTAANIFSLFVMLDSLITGDSTLSGSELLINAAIIYLTNIFMFALWYWEIDGGGPDYRTKSPGKIDFMFPQMIHKEVSPKEWLPGFTDYLYLSATNVTNFAAADTVPISHRAKLLMLVQSLVSVALVLLVIARAVSAMQ